jgi:hypothetical protein
MGEKMKVLVNTLKTLIMIYQAISLIISDLINSVFRNTNKYSWVVGVSEIAGFLHKMSQVYENTFSVCLYVNKYYNHEYSFKNTSNTFLRKIVIILFGPWLLGYLINTTKVFFYVSGRGFLIDYDNSRSFEFYYLKKRRKKINLLFLGSDIRSLNKLYEFGLELREDNIANNLFYVNSFNNENEKKAIAFAADKFADNIFNAKIDQISYLKRETRPIFYIVKEDEYYFSEAKFNSLNRIKIVHAPTDPFLKGTQVIRSVIKKLEIEGYNIEYIELFGKKSLEVIAELRKAHIGINQLYSYLPSVFGIECMANHVALITSADRLIEKDLPAGSEDAWIQTKYWNLYENLLYLLNKPEEIQKQATKGYNFVYKNYHINVIREVLLDTINP